MKIRNETGLAFDDVLLVPRKSTIGSRFDGEISLETKIFSNLELTLPLISANMDSVTGHSMAGVMEATGGIGIIHRFMSIQEQINELVGLETPIACIGVGEESKERLRTINKSISLVGVLIDIAHGHCDAMIEQIKWVKDNFDLRVIAGNIATREAAFDLAVAGADCLKVGVGNGAVCTTRINTANGVPQLTALEDVYLATKEINKMVTVIADGGIKNAGDIVKCFAVGADAVMIGKLFAGTEEAPGEMVMGVNGACKMYRGMASAEAQKSWKGYASSIEGEMTYLPFKGSVSKIIQNLKAGILSGMSYQDAHSLQELRENAEFVRMTNNGLIESKPHALLM